MRTSGMAAAAILMAALVPGWAQQRDGAPAPAQAADPAALPDQEIGRRFTVRPEDLPAPYVGPTVAARPLALPYQGQAPRAPDGFTVTAFATNLAHPRRCWCSRTAT